jgi:hypothetical protein
MLRRVILVRTDVSQERMASIIKLTRVGELAIEACCGEILCKLADSCHPDDGGDSLLRNFGSYKNSTA